MCGIFGWLTPGKPLSLEACFRGLMTLKHRGPDGDGALLGRLSDGSAKAIYEPKLGNLHSFADSHADLFLGHTRLSIIDLNTAASQPLANEDGTVWVVFNGEIYNHAELRKELLGCGHVFRTDHSDTEVLVHGYEQWGEQIVERLRGMFAFAILSMRSRQLFLARDRFGEKPLYLYSGEAGVWFASELKAPLAAGAVRRGISDAGLAHFLAFGFIPAPATVFSEAIKLTAAQQVTIDLNQPTICRPSTYWRLTPATTLPLDQAQERFHEELNTSIRLRMQSDVPLGAFLSGGLDSSIVVREMSKASESAVNTFTIGFREQLSDESKFAGQVATTI